MALTKNTVTVTNIADLSSTPNATEGLTAAQLQAKFDKTGADHKTYINDVLTVEQDAINTTIESRTSSGWIATTGAYASATTITVASGAASKYAKGDKIKLTQTTVKYFYVVTVADTLLTVTGGSDYTLTNAAITDMYYSHEATPAGFPEYFNLSTPTFTTSVTAFTNQPGCDNKTMKIIGNICFLSVSGQSNANSGGTGVFYMTFPSGQIPPFSTGYTIGGAINMNTLGLGYSIAEVGQNNRITFAKNDNNALFGNSNYYGVNISYRF